MDENYQNNNYGQNYQPEGYDDRQNDYTQGYDNGQNYSAQSYQAPQYEYYEARVQFSRPEQPTGKAKAFGIVSLVCGIVSLVGCFTTFEFAIPGIIFGVLAKKAAKEQGVENKKANIGFILSIIGLILGIVGLITYIVIYVLFIGAAVANSVSNSYEFSSALSDALGSGYYY